jgi:hypothetical protein
MATTYHPAFGPGDGYSVIRVTDDPEYTVYSIHRSQADAIHTAALLTADEA